MDPCFAGHCFILYWSAKFKGRLAASDVFRLCLLSVSRTVCCVSFTGQYPVIVEGMALPLLTSDNFFRPLFLLQCILLVCYFLDGLRDDNKYGNFKVCFSSKQC